MAELCACMGHLTRTSQHRCTGPKFRLHLHTNLHHFYTPGTSAGGVQAIMQQAGKLKQGPELKSDVAAFGERLVELAAQSEASLKAVGVDVPAQPQAEAVDQSQAHQADAADVSAGQELESTETAEASAGVLL